MFKALLSIIIFLFSWGVGAQSSLQIPKLSSNATSSEVVAVIDSIQLKMQDEFYKNNYVKVLKYGDIGMELTERIEDVVRGLAISRFIGSSLVRMKDTARAKKLFEQSLSMAKKINDSLSIGNAITDLGNFNNEMENYEEAIALYKQAISVLQPLENQRQLYVLHCNIAGIYLDAGDAQNAKAHIDELSKSIAEMKSPLLQSAYQLLIGKSLLLQNKSDDALTAFVNAIDIAKSLSYRDGIIDGYENYIKALLRKKDFEQAHYERLQLDKFTNEKYKLEKLAAINEVIAKMNVDQYKQELKAKNLENELNEQKAYERKITSYAALGASAILAGLLIFVFISFRNRKRFVTSLQQKNIQYLSAKKKAEDLSKVKTDFLSAISHELRTPLYGIIGISSILQEDVHLESHKEDLSSLKFSADYLLSLINDLLFLNKLEAFKNEELEEKPFQPRDLITSIVNSFEFMRNKNNNDFVIEIDSNIPHFLKGDSHKLSQILMNLIGNACKFTDEGTIVIELVTSAIKSNSVSIHFRIADNGRGISKEKQSIIFDEFTQDSTISNFQGTGLGLAIVKKLLDLHDAPILLKSEKNVGTEFQFTIDYKIANEDEFDVLFKRENVEKDIEGSHILIVDDNRINRLVTQKTLERSSYVCFTAENGRQAVELAKNEVFDLILMDINMPIMNGFEATALIRKFNKTIPIIALTASDPVQIEEDFEAIGMNDIIIKPYETAEFLDVIKRNFLVTLKV